MQGLVRRTTGATYKVLNRALVAACQRKTHKVGCAGAGGRHSHDGVFLLLLLSFLWYSAWSNIWHASIEFSSFSKTALQERGLQRTTAWRETSRPLVVGSRSACQLVQCRLAHGGQLRQKHPAQQSAGPQPVQQRKIVVLLFLLLVVITARRDARSGIQCRKQNRCRRLVHCRLPLQRHRRPQDVDCCCLRRNSGRLQSDATATRAWSRCTNL